MLACPVTVATEPGLGIIWGDAARVAHELQWAAGVALRDLGCGVRLYPLACRAVKEAAKVAEDRLVIQELHEERQGAEGPNGFTSAGLLLNLCNWHNEEGVGELLAEVPKHAGRRLGLWGIA